MNGFEHPRRPPAERRVLLMAPTARDAEAARAVLSAAGVDCELCAGPVELCREAEAGAGALVVPEEAVQGGRESPLCAFLNGQPVWSDLPIVLLSRGGSESPALAEATGALGNVTVVERPVRVSTLLSVVRTALRARERQYQVRDHLAAQARAQESLRQSEARAREEGRVVETISYVGRTLAAELDLRKLLQAVTDATTEITGAAFGAFFYDVKAEQGSSGEPGQPTEGEGVGDAGAAGEVRAPGGAGPSYSLYALSAGGRERPADFPMPRDTELFRRTLRGGRVVRLADAAAEIAKTAESTNSTRSIDRSDASESSGAVPVRSYLAVPVVGRSGRVLGGLFLGHANAGLFDERDERTVVGIAAQAAVAIDNARLFEAARRADAAKDLLLAAERSARAEAERANRLKDEFLSVVSHELRTPLNAILGWSQLLRPGAFGGGAEGKSGGASGANAADNAKSAEEDLREGLEAIDRNARAQSQIIEDLLDMGRIISGKVRLDVQRVDLPGVIDAAMESMRPAADARGVQLQKVLDPLAGPIRGDPSRLQQVVWNLVSNAIKFTPRGGRVGVTLARADSSVQIEVRDTGEGIPPEFLPYVFERFRQAEKSTTRRHGGLGLGLSIVKNLVELHGGTVRASSAGVGQGAVFCVNLPLMPVRPEEDVGPPRPHPRSASGGAGAAGAAGAAGPGPIGRHPTTLAGLRVLVVDDEPDARTLLKRFLQDCGAGVTAVASAGEALAAVGAGRFDVIVSDIGMPDRDGYDLARALRALPPDRGGRTPAVALTAFARSEDRTRAMLAGFDVHVAKPVEQAELCAAVARLGGRPPTAAPGETGGPCPP